MIAETTPRGRMYIKTVPIESLSADPANARRHDQKNINVIKASLKRFGQRKNIVVDQNGIVRAGNGTLEAAKQLGWTEITVSVMDAPATSRQRAVQLRPVRSNDVPRGTA